MIAVKRLVQFTNRLDHIFVIGTDYDALRTHAVCYRCPFLQELWVGNHIERHFAATFLQGFFHHLADFICGADRHGRFVDHHFVFGHVLRDGARNGSHVFQIGRTVFIRRCSHRDKLNGTMRHPSLGIGGKMQAAGFIVLLNQWR
ncbi:hypothetical protein D3C72_1542210 [compost metagenome]